MTQARLLDGKTLASTIRANLKARIATRVSKGLRPPCLAVILVGDNPASAIYVRNKREACLEVGITSLSHTLPDSVSEKALTSLLDELSNNKNVDGILLQLPLPATIDAGKVLEHIHPDKDVDGFHPYNLGRLAQRRPVFRPCTPYGVIKLLETSGETYQYRHAVVIGTSNIVGRPMALELLASGATVTLCHRLTAHMDFWVKQADILVSAVGKPSLVKGEWIKLGATVIDIGITRLEDGTLKGDIEFETARARAAWITPVPGGVGPMTVAMLLENTFMASCRISECV